MRFETLLLLFMWLGAGWHATCRLPHTVLGSVRSIPRELTPSLFAHTPHTPSIHIYREILAKAPGVELRDEPEKNTYPMPLTATAKYDVEVRFSLGVLGLLLGFVICVCGGGGDG